MRTLRLGLAYDGTAFHGWQIQPSVRTVQGVLEEALRRVFETDEFQDVSGAGRTDAGVHARGQVVTFRTASRLPARAIAPLVNRLLPDDVRVTTSADAEPEFHARHSATRRRYAYRVLDRPDVLLGRFAWHAPRPPAVERLDAATRVLETEDDFSAFRGAGSTPGSPRCRIERARWTRIAAGLRFDIVADRFLYHMVRNVVGTAFEAAGSADPAGAMAEVLASRERARGGATAPAHGLCLERVRYDGARP